jgi:hypothetical protein
MFGFTGVLCGETLMCACIHDLIDTRFVVCGYSSVLCSYALMCACLNMDTCVMCGYTGVLDCGVTHLCVHASVVGHQHCRV